MHYLLPNAFYFNDNRQNNEHPHPANPIIRCPRIKFIKKSCQKGHQGKKKKATDFLENTYLPLKTLTITQKKIQGWISAAEHNWPKNWLCNRARNQHWERSCQNYRIHVAEQVALPERLHRSILCFLSFLNDSVVLGCVDSIETIPRK